MKTQSLGYLTTNFLEPLLTGLLLFYFLNPAVPSLVKRILDPGSYLITAFLILLHWKRFIYVATRDLPLLLLFLMIGVSIFWSALPESTSITSKAVLRAMLIGVYVATRYRVKEQMQLLYWVFSIAILFALVDQSIFRYKNYLAIYMVFAAMLFLLTALSKQKRRRIALIGFGTATTLMFLSQGKGGYVIFFVSLLLIPLHKFIKQKYKLRVIFILTIILFGGVISALVVNNLETIVVDILGKDLEFNGRTPVWTLAIEQASKRPWLGHGMDGFWGSYESLVIKYGTWGGRKFQTIDDFKSFNSHNGYLEIILQLGFLGFFIYAFGWLKTFIRLIFIWASTASIESFWLLQSLIIIFLFDGADSGGSFSKGTLWILYVSISLSSTLWYKRLKQYRKSQKYFYDFK